MGERGGGSSCSYHTSSLKLKEAARKMVNAACAPFSCTPKHHQLQQPLPISNYISLCRTKTEGVVSSSLVHQQQLQDDTGSNITISSHHDVPSMQNLCAICLEALSDCTDNSLGETIFTAQCTHSFHLGCISSNVRHGNISCPICRANWTRLPRDSNPCNQPDPIIRILDYSIATSRIHRRSPLRSARHNDDQTVEAEYASDHPRLSFSLTPLPRQQYASSSALLQYGLNVYTWSTVTNMRGAYLTVKLTEKLPTDLVLLASFNRAHMRLLKQSMALVMSSLHAVDRLAIVTCSSTAAQIFPLRRMTSSGKQTAIQAIDSLFYSGQADPTEGFKKAIKVLEDRADKIRNSCILHLSDHPARSYHSVKKWQTHIPIHEFHLGPGFCVLNGFVMHEFEKHLARLLGGVIGDVQLRIGEEGRIMRLGELRGSEERKLLMELGDCAHVCIGYSYIEGVDVNERNVTGETIVSLIDGREVRTSYNEPGPGREAGLSIGLSSTVGSWDYHEPYVGRRCNEDLHGYRL